ncbi:MAG TPA: hypothetical protein VFB94_12190 [Acidimicrobiales bacterium]|nr:hypothetical protein [Acidimicrobiales bacterium]
MVIVQRGLVTEAMQEPLVDVEPLGDQSCGPEVVEDVWGKDEGGATWFEALVHGSQEGGGVGDVFDHEARDGDVEVLGMFWGELLEGCLVSFVEPLVGQDVDGGIDPYHAALDGPDPGCVVRVSGPCADVEQERLRVDLRGDHRA